MPASWQATVSGSQNSEWITRDLIAQERKCAWEFVESRSILRENKSDDPSCGVTGFNLVGRPHPFFEGKALETRLHRLNFVVINDGSWSGPNYPLKTLPWKPLMTKKQLFAVKHSMYFPTARNSCSCFCFLFLFYSFKDETVKNWVKRPKLERASLNIFLKLGIIYTAGTN